MKKDSIPYVVIFTFVTCAVFVVVLAMANEGTKDLVAANKKYSVQSAILGAFGIDYADKAAAAGLFAKEVETIQGAGYGAWRARVNGVEYLAVEQSGAGLWGSISIILAASPDGERARGVRLVAHNETPGLGGRIEEAWFLEQYSGERAPGGRIGMRAGAESSGKADTDKENGRVDGISGATRTSQAFAAIVDAALARVKATGGVR